MEFAGRGRPGAAAFYDADDSRAQYYRFLVPPHPPPPPPHGDEDYYLAARRREELPLWEWELRDERIRRGRIMRERAWTERAMSARLFGHPGYYSHTQAPQMALSQDYWQHRRAPSLPPRCHYEEADPRQPRAAAEEDPACSSAGPARRARRAPPVYPRVDRSPLRDGAADQSTCSRAGAARQPPVYPHVERSPSPAPVLQRSPSPAPVIMQRSPQACDAGDQQQERPSPRSMLGADLEGCRSPSKQPLREGDLVPAFDAGTTTSASFAGETVGVEEPSQCVQPLSACGNQSIGQTKTAEDSTPTVKDQTDELRPADVENGASDEQKGIVALREPPTPQAGGLKRKLIADAATPVEQKKQKPNMTCDVCQVTLPSANLIDHWAGKRHVANMKAWWNKQPAETKRLFDDNGGGGGPSAPRREKPRRGKSENAPRRVEDEKDRETAAAVLSGSWVTTCPVCDVKCHSDAVRRDHLAGRRHRENTEALFDRIRSSNTRNRNKDDERILGVECMAGNNGGGGPSSSLRQEKRRGADDSENNNAPRPVEDDEEDREMAVALSGSWVTCPVCDVKCQSDAVRRDHLAGRRHRENTEALLDRFRGCYTRKNYDDILEKTVYHCTVCDASFPGDTMLAWHFVRRHHGKP